LSNLPSWSHVSKPRHEGFKVFFVGLLAGIILALAAMMGIYVGAPEWLEQVATRHRERITLAPLVAEAERLSISYNQLAAKPQDFLGKPVLWCVDHPDVGGRAYLEGKPSQPLAFSNSDVLPPTGSRGGHCVKMLAVVESSASLHYLGTP
jgi:hypothetical protein